MLSVLKCLYAGMLMRVRICSDIHVDAWITSNPIKNKRILLDILPSLPTDKKDVLIIAGDFAPLHKNYYQQLISYLCRRFLAVIAVPGNHEYYHNTWFGATDILLKERDFPKNFHLLEKDYVIINDVAFIGCALWTDFNHYDPMAMFHAQRSMNDFKCIRYRDYYTKVNGDKDFISKVILPEHVATMHESSKSFISSALRSLSMYDKRIVITHHSPSERTASDRFKGDLLNYAYFSNLEDIIETYKPNYWIYGHQHDALEIVIDNTVLINNSYGYRNYEVDKGYNKEFIIEV